MAGGLDVAAGRERQPQVVVRAARAHAAVQRRMPPVLDVAVDELVLGAEQQVAARQGRLGMQHRHRVLQLVAEAERAARLVVAAARQVAAADGLVQQPRSEEHTSALQSLMRISTADLCLTKKTQHTQKKTQKTS